MGFMRVAVFEIPDAPADALEVWDDLVGSALRNNPECTSVMVSKNGTTYAAVSTWTSEAQFTAATESKPYQDVVATVTARLGLPESYEPSFVYQGEIA